MRPWVAALAAALALAGGGCSLLFDPDAVVTVDGAPPADLAAPRDLAPEPPPPDLAPPADLAPDDCGTVVFGGFGANPAPDAGVSCNRCGCLLDDFHLGVPDPAVWSVGGTAGWTATTGDGGVIDVAKAPVTTNDAWSLDSAGHFYLDGDYLLRVDYSVAEWYDVAALLAVVDSMAHVALAEEYVLNAADNGYLQLDQGKFPQADPFAVTALRTFELSRTGAVTCASLVGFHTECAPSGTERQRVRLIAVQAANTVPRLAVRFARPRLLAGTLVPAP